MRTHPITILVIDEHKEDRAALRQCLTEADSKVRIFEAASGETALEWFQTTQPDCVVMELKLKDVVGMEVLGRIAAEMKRKPVPIFIWTRLGHTMLRTTASSFGVSGYFEKHRGSEQALVAAIRAAMTDQQNESQSMPPV